MTKRKILLVEDDVTLGDLLVYVLAKRDYEATWFCRARLDSAGHLIFITDRGVESDFDSAQNIALRQEYTCALVDSRLKGSALQGVEVTRALASRGLKVIATSGLSTLNKQLLEAGAVAAIEKFDIVSHLSGAIDLMENLKAN